MGGDIGWGSGYWESIRIAARVLGADGQAEMSEDCRSARIGTALPVPARRYLPQRIAARDRGNCERRECRTRVPGRALTY